MPLTLHRESIVRSLGVGGSPLVTHTLPTAGPGFSETQRVILISAAASDVSPRKILSASGDRYSTGPRRRDLSPAV